jgi:hypothetical protein
MASCCSRPPLPSRLAHAHDPARAEADTDLSAGRERVEAVLIGTRRDDLAVEVGGGVEVVVVIVESGIGQCLGLMVGKHPECHARLHTEVGDGVDCLRNLVDLSIVR